MHTSIRVSHVAIMAVVAAHLGCVSSLSVPFRRQAANPSTDDPFAFRVVDFTGDGDIIYVANITLDGQQFEVQLDTGSSDLWVNTQNITLPNINDTKIHTEIGYGDMSTAEGDVYLAPLQFGNYSIPQQAFINAPGSNATSDNDLGLLGLGASDISQVYGALNGTQYNGQTVMYNLFKAYPNTSTYITFLLTRSNLGISDGGIFTIGETDSNWSQILNQPHTYIIQQLQQWLTFLDGVTVNGKNYSGQGILSELSHAGIPLNELPRIEVSPSDKPKPIALFDTGTSTGVLPQYYFDAIYKGIPGIKTISEKAGLYEIPCDTKLNVSMTFNGTEVPINPLDLTMLSMNEKNETICVNAWSPWSLKARAEQLVDFILGDAFLRNVYILYNYGNWTSTNSEAPYVQLLPTTIQSDAWEQFDSLNQARIAQWEQLGGQYNTTSSN